MWLTGRLMPNFKTIAQLPKKTTAKHSRRLPSVRFCLPAVWGCLAKNLVAIDGSKIKAVNKRATRNFTSAKLKSGAMERNRASISRYLVPQLDAELIARYLAPLKPDTVSLER